MSKRWICQATARPTPRCGTGLRLEFKPPPQQGPSQVVELLVISRKDKFYV